MKTKSFTNPVASYAARCAWDSGTSLSGNDGRYVGRRCQTIREGKKIRKTAAWVRSRLNEGRFLRRQKFRLCCCFAAERLDGEVMLFETLSARGKSSEANELAWSETRWKKCFQSEGEKRKKKILHTNQAGDFRSSPLSFFLSLPLLPSPAMSKSAKAQQQNKLPDELVEKLESALLLALSKQGGDGSSPIDSGDFAAAFGLKPIDVVGLVKSLVGAEMVEAKVRMLRVGFVATL